MTKLLRVVREIGMVLALVLLAPVAIILVGAPLVLLVRLVIELAT
jgi:hypothetical protein